MKVFFITKNAILLKNPRGKKCHEKSKALSYDIEESLMAEILYNCFDWCIIFLWFLSSSQCKQTIFVPGLVVFVYHLLFLIPFFKKQLILIALV